jgi:hypothetical protein
VCGKNENGNSQLYRRLPIGTLPAVARRRIVHVTSGRRKAGIRDRILEVCGALHHVWVRFTSWQQMVESE